MTFNTLRVTNERVNTRDLFLTRSKVRSQVTITVRVVGIAHVGCAYELFDVGS